MKPDNGGAAFPRTAGDVAGIRSGMSMLEYYAAHSPMTLDDARSAWAKHPDRREDFNHTPTWGQLIELLAAINLTYATAMVELLGKVEAERNMP